ncbi:MAG: hypothetical protein AAF334_10430 [Pseudomonadota bacterium]
MFWLLPCLILLAGILAGAFATNVLGRTAALLLCVVAAFWLGIAFEKFSFVDRHIDMCADETSQYFREHGGFDPYCEVLNDG